MLSPVNDIVLVRKSKQIYIDKTINTVLYHKKSLPLKSSKFMVEIA